MVITLAAALAGGCRVPPPPQPVLFSCILVLFWLLDLFHSPSRFSFAEQWSVEPLLIWGDRGGLAGVGALVPPTRCTVTLVTGSDGDLSRLMVPKWESAAVPARGHCQPGTEPRASAGACQRSELVLEMVHMPTVLPETGWRPPSTGRVPAAPAPGLPWEGAAAGAGPRCRGGCATAWGLVQPVYSVAGADGLQASGCRWFGLWRGWGHGDWKHIAQGAPWQCPRCPQPVPVTPPHRGCLPSPPPSCAWEPCPIWDPSINTPRGPPIPPGDTQGHQHSPAQGNAAGAAAGP